MRNATFYISIEHAIVITEAYNRLITSGKYTHTPAHESLSAYAADYVTTLLKEYVRDENWSLNLGAYNVLFLKGAYGTIALCKYSGRKKVLCIAPDEFWAAAPALNLDTTLIKWLIRNSYLAKS